jgi:surfactin synthase thioesterase subunit
MESDSYALVCLPPAGCSANIYQIFKKYAPSNCHVFSLDYPGHGRKLSQPLSSDIHHIVQQLALEISALPHLHIVLFGHSLGAGLLLPLINQLKHQNCLSKIKLVILSSRPAPHHSQHLTGKQTLSDQALLLELKNYAYLPQQILDNPELMRFCLKLIRHDFALSDALITHSHNMCTDLPMLVVAGDQDPDLKHPTMLDTWQNYTHQWLGVEQFKGHHFYFMDQDVVKDMLNCIDQHVQHLIMHAQEAAQ